MSRVFAALRPVRAAFAYLSAPEPRRFPARSGEGRTLPAGRGAREQQIRTLLGWGPREYAAALRRADAGDISAAADIWDAVWGTDERCLAAVDTRCSQLVGCELTFEESETGGRKRKRDRVKDRSKPVKALEDGGDWWEMCTEQDIKLIQGWYLGLRVALAELVWVEPDPITGEEIARIRNGRNVPLVKVWHPRCLRYDWDERCWYARLDDGAETKVRNGDGRWILLGGETRCWARGLWRPLAPLVLLKGDAQVDWARHNEKYANGIIAVTGETGTDDNLRREIADDILSLGAEGVVVLPIGFKAAVMQLGADAYETFEKREAAVNQAIPIAVLGGNLGTEASAGAEVGAEGQRENQQHRLRGDAEIASTGFHEGLLQPWAFANFGDRELAPWPTWHTDPPEDKAQLVAVWKTAAEAITALDPLCEVDWDDAKDRAGLPIKGPKARPLAALPDPAPASLPAGQPQPEPLQEAA